MLITPSDHWQWYFDDEHDRMMLDLADGMLFRSRFSRKMLTPDAFAAQRFCVEDATLYFSFAESTESLTLNDEQRAELILNALTALRFLKPQMPKSWHFIAHDHIFMYPQKGEIMCAQVSDTGEWIDLLVIEGGSNATLCMLAQPMISLAGRTMLLGEAIKIMNDRLTPKTVFQNDIELSQVI